MATAFFLVYSVVAYFSCKIALKGYHVYSAYQEQAQASRFREQALTVSSRVKVSSR